MFSEYEEASMGRILAGEGDWFSAQLARLIVKADINNQTRLSLGFPTEVAFIQNYLAGEKDGIHDHR